MAIIGSTGSGKTSMKVNLLINYLTYKKAFNTIHIFTLRRQLENKCVYESPKMHDELTWTVIDGILESVMEDAEEKYNCLLILDDVTANLKDKALQHLLQKTIYKQRHYRLGIMILVKSYDAMPLSIRRRLSHFLSYKSSNRKDYAAIFLELIFLETWTKSRVRLQPGSSSMSHTRFSLLTRTLICSTKTSTA